MQSLVNRVESLQLRVEDAFQQLKIDELTTDIQQLTEELNKSEIWANPEYAQTQSKKLAQLQQLVDPWVTLRAQLLDIKEFIELGDETLVAEFEKQVDALEESFEENKKALYFTGQYDDYDVILRLSAGVGGTDAQDWTEILERMYLRWAEANNYTTKVIDRMPGEEAGLKSATIELSGTKAYGHLKSEHGVHRLVRLSPFNSDNLRQTSFALVEVLPQITAPDDVAVADSDLKIDVYRAGGHGGQSVNTTDSAVRITHLPTGITVAIQNERSQLQNKETALKILRSKLIQLQLDQHAESIAELQAGESANWGSQIRNYVLHPYTLVKDTRTKYETKDTKAVLDGDINQFITAYLERGLSQ